MAPVKVNVRYHVEPEGVWAESDDVPGFSAAGESLGEVRGLVREGLAFHLDDEPFELAEEMAQPAGYVHVGNVKASFFVSLSASTAPVAVGKFRTAGVSTRHSIQKAATEAPEVRRSWKDVPV